MKIKVNKFTKILSVMFGVSLIGLTLSLSLSPSNINKENNNFEINSNHNQLNLLNDYNLIEEAWTMSNTIVVKDTVGDIWSWGRGDFGQNGDGSNEDRIAPEKINQFNSTNTIVDAWAMSDTIIAKDTSGDVWSWGYGGDGQNGDGEAQHNLTPNKITQFSSTNTISDVWAMSDTIIAKDDVGDIWSWGRGTSGQNGNGNPSNNNTPEKIHDVDGSTNIFGQGITIEDAWTMNNTIITKDTDGDIWSWGAGTLGQNGDGDPSNNNTPEKIHDVDGMNNIFGQDITIKEAWTMADTIVAKDTADEIWSWGAGIVGQNGDGETENNITPNKINEFNSTNTIVDAWTMTNTIIAKDSVGDIYSWGLGNRGQTGDGEEENNPAPNKMNEFNSTNTIVDAWAMANTITAKDTSGDIWIWGQGDRSQTGDEENNMNYVSPEKMTQFNNNNTIVNAWAMFNTIIAKDTTGDIWAWGEGSFGQNGDGEKSPLNSPEIIFQLFSEGSIKIENLTPISATVIVEDFKNGIGVNQEEAAKATLTYGMTGEDNMTMDVTDLSDGVSFNLVDLIEEQTYNLSISYFNSSDVQIGSPITSTLTTNKSEPLIQGNLVVSNITATTATVTVEGFSNGTGNNLATKAILTYDVAGKRATLEDNDLSDGVSFNLTGLTEGQRYNLSVAYQNSNGDQIGESIDPENPLVPQPPSSGGGGLSTGAIIGIAAGAGGAVLIGGGVGGFFLYKKKRGF